MDDETEVDPMGFLNTNAYDCDIDMMSQPYAESSYQLANEDMDDMPGQGRTMDCKKSLFMKSSQDTPEDAASTQAQLAGREGRTVLSPGTLGQGLRKGLEGVPKKKERKRSGKIAASKQARACTRERCGHVPSHGRADATAETARGTIRGSQETARPGVVD